LESMKASAPSLPAGRGKELGERRVP